MKSPIKLRYVLGAIIAAALYTSFSGNDDELSTDFEKHASEKHTEIRFCTYTADEKTICSDDLAELEALKEELNKAALPAPNPAQQNESLAENTVPIGDVYEMAGKRFTVSPDVKAAFLSVEANFEIPYDAMVASCARESDCIPEQINKSSKACGLFQFMTNDTATLYEVTWRYAKAYGYEEQDKLVERFAYNQEEIDAVKAENKTKPSSERRKLPKAVFGYRPVSEEAKLQLIEACKDPLFNATMWGAYKKPHIEDYNEWLGDREISPGEIVAMNNLGKLGLQMVARQAWADASDPGEDMLAVDFFKKHQRTYGGDMSANKTLIRHPNRNYKTVREAYHDMMKFGGYGELTMVSSAPSLTQ